MLEDFVWLLENAADPSKDASERENYAEFARVLPILDRHEAVETWLRLRDREPVRSKLGYSLSIRLNSDEARKAKEFHAKQKHRTDRESEERGVSAPHERVRLVLDLAETKDPRFFFDLCRELRGSDKTS